jgi:hypothetical protein
MTCVIVTPCVSNLAVGVQQSYKGHQIERPRPRPRCPRRSTCPCPCLFSGGYRDVAPWYWSVDLTTGVGGARRGGGAAPPPGGASRRTPPPPPPFGLGTMVLLHFEFGSSPLRSSGVKPSDQGRTQSEMRVRTHLRRQALKH